MLITGAEKLERMRDGREVYIGSERVKDVTVHPAFARGAKTIAEMWDWKNDPSRAELMTYAEDGARHSLYWLRAKTRDELARRMAAMKALADFTYGLVGRSPDQVASLVAGLATNAAVLDRVRQGFGANLLAYYDYARNNDLFLTFAAIAPAGLRTSEQYAGAERDMPSLRVVAEDDKGVYLSGIKILATSAVYADELYIGNLAPLDPKHDAQSITCAMPMNTPGLALWSRQPFALHAKHEADYPLSWRYDESDAMVVCDRALVPWERVFLHMSGAMARQIYLDTPGMCYANHHSTVRLWSKMGLITGLASRVAEANGVSKIAGVREQLGRFAQLEATIAALCAGQIEGFESWPGGFVSPNRRYMYAAVAWGQDHHSLIIDELRTLLGSMPLQMPASVDVLEDAALRDKFERWFKAPDMSALDRLKLYKVAWDLVGSEFAGRHQLYDKFYAGNVINNRNHNFREAPWARFHGMVEELLARIGTV
jgi:4-hydroxyphenylacetate 3-monooxygenase